VVHGTVSVTSDCRVVTVTAADPWDPVAVVVAAEPVVSVPVAVAVTEEVTDVDDASPVWAADVWLRVAVAVAVPVVVAVAMAVSVGPAVELAAVEVGVPAHSTSSKAARPRCRLATMGSAM
jgi:hypothetical protein